MNMKKPVNNKARRLGAVFFALILSSLVALSLSGLMCLSSPIEDQTFNTEDNNLPFVLSQNILLVSYKSQNFAGKPVNNEPTPSPSSSTSKTPLDLIPKIKARDEACEKSLGMDEDGGWKKQCDSLTAELKSLVPASTLDSIRAKMAEVENVCKDANSLDAPQDSIDKCDRVKQELRELAPSTGDPTPPPANMSDEEKEKRIQEAVEACKANSGFVVDQQALEKCEKYKKASGNEQEVKKRLEESGGNPLEKLAGAISGIAGAIKDPVTAILGPSARFFASSTGDALRQFQLEWLTEESLARSSGSQDAAEQVRALTLPLASFILLASIFWQAIVIMITRRSQPFVDIVRGLFTFLFWTGIAIGGSQIALQISDELAIWIFNTVSNKQSMFNDMADLLQGKTNVAGFVLDSLGTLLLSPVLNIAVWIMKFSFLFRDLSMIILSGVLSLAAAGSLTNATREWLFKIISWMLSLIAYKPAVAMIYATATLLSKAGKQSGASIDQFMLGALAIFLSIFALPVLTRFFTWGTGQATGAGAAPALQTFSTQYAQYGYGKR